MAAPFGFVFWLRFSGFGLLTFGFIFCLRLRWFIFYFAIACILQFRYITFAFSTSCLRHLYLSSLSLTHQHSMPRSQVNLVCKLRHSISRRKPRRKQHNTPASEDPHLCTAVNSRPDDTISDTSSASSASDEGRRIAIFEEKERISLMERKRSLERYYRDSDPGELPVPAGVMEENRNLYRLILEFEQCLTTSKVSLPQQCKRL